MARATKRIIVEEANPLLMKEDYKNPSKRLNVCAYARVSTDDAEQLTSYKAQVSYYNNYIQEHDNWNFVDVFTDEGITGTNTFKRVGFNKMIKMCKQGKVDLIITKSVSRFARNTIDSLKTCKELKDRNIGVLFEKENINTLKNDIEVHLAVASSMAQDESRNISENVKWGFKRKFENGGIMIVTSKFLGYDCNEDGELVINEEEAKIVRKIFDMFLKGYTYSQIARHLTDERISTVTGKEVWNAGVIRRMLQNEKYVGNCISQKTYTKDFLTHKRVKNQGELAKYIIENNHEAIISKEEFLAVQEKATEINDHWKKKRGKKIISSKYLLSNLLFCGKCGSPLRRKSWRSHNGRVEIQYGCKARLKANGGCKGEYINEKKLKTGIMSAVNKHYTSSNQVQEIQNVDIKKIGKLEKKIKDLRASMMQMIQGDINATSQEIISEGKLSELANEINTLENEKKKLTEKMHTPSNSVIGETKYEAYDEDILRKVIDKIKVNGKNEVEIYFKGGYVIQQEI